MRNRMTSMTPAKFIHVLLGCLVLAWSGETRAAAGAEAKAASQASVLVCGGSMMNGGHFADSVLEVMREHFAGCRQVALVLHASHPSERDAMEKRLQTAFVHLLGAGVKAESVHRFDVAGAKKLLTEADGIFVGGGETFVLLGELYRLGQLDVIRERVRAGVPFGGSSAGANVAGPVIGATNDFPTAVVPSTKALGIFPAVINPHYPQAESKAELDARVYKIRTYLKFNPEESVCAMGNVSVLRLHEGRVTLRSGRVALYRASGVRELVVGEVVPELGR